MFGTFLGLPAHPLFVHGAVVLVPLSALVTAWVAWASPARRRAFGLPAAVLSAIALVAAFVAKESGEWLEHHTASDPLVQAHAQLGDLLPVFAGLMFLTSLLVWWLARRGRPETHTGAATNARVEGATGHGSHAGANAAVGTSGTASRIVAVLGTLLALLACFWTFRVGHTGAEAVWHDADLTQQTQTGGGN